MRNGFATLLLEVDPRVKVLLAMGLGVLIWNAGWLGLACFASGLLWLHWRLGLHDRARLRDAAMVAAFVGFWAVAAIALALWEGVAPEAAIVRGAALGLRLLLLLLLGLGLAAATPARDMGLALAWGLRPILGKRAWQAALALALMLHFLPQGLSVLRQVRAGLTARSPQCALWVLPGVAAQATLRVMAQRAWTQTVGLAARGLDTEAAWRPDFEPRPQDWWAGAALMGMGVLAALL